MLIGFKKWELAQISSDVAFSNYVVKINLTLAFGLCNFVEHINNS